jgi:Raf kinase inhibitor-like YbhB/YbcL family protein
MAELTLTSTAFGHDDEIPRRHTCDGDDISPPLAWSGQPPETRSLALVLDDPDAPGGIFTHWLAWGIDPTAGGLAEGETPAVEGRNDFDSAGYGGPCPPPGHGRHRYVFHLHALDTELALLAGEDKGDLERALADHVLATAELIGTYERKG